MDALKEAKWYLAAYNRTKEQVGGEWNMTVEEKAVKLLLEDMVRRLEDGGAEEAGTITEGTEAP